MCTCALCTALCTVFWVQPYLYISSHITVRQNLLTFGPKKAYCFRCGSTVTIVGLMNDADKKCELASLESTSFIDLLPITSNLHPLKMLHGSLCSGVLFSLRSFNASFILLFAFLKDDSSSSASSTSPSTATTFSWKSS